MGTLKSRQRKLWEFPNRYVFTEGVNSMSYRRTLQIYVLCVAMLFGIWSSEALAATPPDKTVSLTFWRTGWSDPLGQDIDMLTEVYQKKNPGVKIRIQLQGGDSELGSKLVVAVAGGAPPDITTLNGAVVRTDQIPDYILEPLSPFLKKDNLLDAFIPECVGKYAWGEEIYAMPYSIDPNFPLIYNEDIFAERGIDPRSPIKTIDDLNSVSQKLYAVGPDGGIKLAPMVPWRQFAMSTAFWTWARAFGGREDDGQQYTVNSKENLETAQWMINFGNRFGGTKKLDLFGAQAGPHWKLEKVAMGFFVSAHIPACMNAVPGIRLGAIPIPSKPGVPTPVWFGGQWLGIPKGAKHPKEAYEFIKWMCTDPEALRISARSRLAGTKGAYSGGIYSPEVFQRGGLDPQTARLMMVYVFLAARGSELPFHRSQVKGGIPDFDRVMYQAIVEQSMDPKVALDDLNRRANAQLQELLKREAERKR